MSQTMTPPAGGPGGGMPMGGMGGAPGGDDTDAGDSDDQVVATVTLSADGTWTIYVGDEPEGDSESDMSEDDASAMGAAGQASASPAPQDQGQKADSLGQALKILMSVMQDAESSGPGGSANDQFSAGFNGTQSPTPAVGSASGQKY